MRTRTVIRCGACLLPLAACESGYQGAPRPCDDWCLVTQRAGCEDDWPAECVADCVDRGTERMALACPQPWTTLLDCHRSTPDTEYYCAASRSRPRNDVCSLERKNMLRCGNPDVLGCFDQCDLAEAWSLGNGDDCYRDCLTLRALCGRVATDYFACVERTNAAGAPDAAPSLGVDEAACPDSGAALLDCLEQNQVRVFENEGGL